MSNGETRALLPKAGGACAAPARQRRRGDCGCLGREKCPGRGGTSPRRACSRPAAALVVLICASRIRARATPSPSARGWAPRRTTSSARSSTARTSPFSDASAGLGLKTHRRGAEAEEDAEKDIERVARNPPKPAEGKKAPEKEVEPVAKKPSREVDETPRDEGKAASNATVASKASKTSKTRSETNALDDRVELSGAVDKKHADPPDQSSAKTHSRKPRILVAVISWHDGAEGGGDGAHVAGRSEGCGRALDADYRVFVGEYDDANLGGRHAELRTREHKERRGFGGDELAAALGTRGGSSRSAATSAALKRRRRSVVEDVDVFPREAPRARVRNRRRAETDEDV